MSIIIDDKKIVNKIVMTFEEISKLFNNIENGNKIVNLCKNKFTNTPNEDENPNITEIEIADKNPIKKVLNEVYECTFNCEDFIEARKNKADKIIKIEFFNEENKGFKITRESELETEISSIKTKQQTNHIKDVIEYFDQFESTLDYSLSRDSLLDIKEMKPSEFFKVILTENDILVKDPYYFYENDDYLIDLRTSKKYLLGLKYKTSKREVVCPEVNLEVYAPETDVYTEFVMLKFIIKQDKFVANLKFLLYNI